MILLFDRLTNKLLSIYRKELFRKKTGCTHKDFNIRGKLHLINRNVHIGHKVSFYPDVMIFGDGQVSIGDNVSIGNGTVIYSSKEAGISIGDNVQIAAHAYIIDTDHGIKKGIPIREQENTFGRVTIGNDVWLAAGCKVLKGSTIHDGVVVGAQAVVKGELPENSICVGIPAQPIKKRE